VIASGVVIWQVAAVKPVSEHPSGPQPIVSPVSETVPVVLSVAVEAPVSCVIERETVQPVEGDPPLSSLAVIGSVVVFEPPSATLKAAGLLAVTDNTPGITSVVIVGHCSVTPGLQAANAWPAPLNARRAISNRPTDSPTMSFVSFILFMG